MLFTNEGFENEEGLIENSGNAKKGQPGENKVQRKRRSTKTSKQPTEHEEIIENKENEYEVMDGEIKA